MCGGIVLEEALNVSSDRLLDDDLKGIIFQRPNR